MMTTGAGLGEIAEVGSPVDVPADPSVLRSPLRWTTTTLATAALLLSIFNARAAADWLDDLPQDSSIVSTARPPLRAWAAAMHGFGGPRRWMSARWRSVLGLRFGDERPGENGAEE